MTIKLKPIAELPKPQRGRQSQYVQVVADLAAKPGQAFEVGTYNSPSAAQSARQALLKEAKKAGVQVDAVASGKTLYAQAGKTRARVK